MAVVGFIGVGRMGGPMASRLLDAGHELCIYDVSAEATKPFAARGARIAASPADDLRGTWELMTRRRLQNLPLLAPSRQPIGTLDLRDALKEILQAEEAQETQLINYIAGYGYH